MPQISALMGILASTLHKAIDDGRLRQLKKKTDPRPRAEPAPVVVTKSERSVIDSQAALGVATTRLDERLLASLGKLHGAPIRFEMVTDVPRGGVLFALPALLALGLLRHTTEHFALPPGYYPVETIFLSIAFLALARIPSVEALRYEPPGEWGRVLGLDRIPEVRTLRGETHPALQGGQAGARMERPVGAGMDGSRTGDCGHPVHRRSCAGVSRWPDPAARAVCGPAALAFAGHDRLLG